MTRGAEALGCTLQEYQALIRQRLFTAPGGIAGAAPPAKPTREKQPNSNDDSPGQSQEQQDDKYASAA